MTFFWQILIYFASTRSQLLGFGFICQRLGYQFFVWFKDESETPTLFLSQGLQPHSE